MSWYWISPNSIRWDKNITDKEKLLLIELSSLAAAEGFAWASNDYLWDKMNCDARTISRHLTSLEKKWYINREMENVGKNNTKRKVFLIDKGVWTKMSTPPRQNCLPNNNIYNNLLKEIKEYKILIKNWDFGWDVKVLEKELSDMISSLDGWIKNSLSFNLPQPDELWPVGLVLLEFLKRVESWNVGIKLMSKIIVDKDYIDEVTDKIMQRWMELWKIPKVWDIPELTITKVKIELENMLNWYDSNWRIVKNLTMTTNSWFTKYFSKQY